MHVEITLTHNLSLQLFKSDRPLAITNNYVYCTVMTMDTRSADILVQRLLQESSRLNDVREAASKLKFPHNCVKSIEQRECLEQRYNPVYKQAELEARLLRMCIDSTGVGDKKA